MKNNVKATPILIVTAVIWGFAFVAQRLGAEHLRSFSFNGIRFALGAVSLIPVVLILERKQLGSFRFRSVLLPSAVSGTILFLASFFQQYGVELSGSAGKAGFLTDLYIVLVPVTEVLFFRKRKGISLWIGVLLAFAGLYLITLGNLETEPGWGDFFLVICAFFWTAHILAVDRFMEKGLPPLLFSCTQFFMCSVWNLIFAFPLENPTWEAVSAAGIPILYGGLMSVGVAYTLQVVGQRYAEPAFASIVLSLECMFSAVGGALILDERMGVAGWIGCALMLIGIMVPQLFDRGKENQTGE
ncbi:MAG: DMT family transporter [Clostridia bacterium]|nr:DMT family transporter [Clostridia bacterium]